MKDEVRWGGVPKGPGGLVDWRSPPGLGVGGEAVVAISAASHCRLRDSQEWECFFDCSHEIKGLLLLGRKVANLDSILKSRDFILPTKSI